MTEEYLQAIFEKYGTDKAEKGYSAFYSRHLPDRVGAILEIGVKEGASIRAWKEVYPDAKVIGLDLFEEFPIPDIPGATFIKGSQTDGKVLEELRGFNFDVVIDDGSHNSRDQMISFFGLAASNVLYFIEDQECQSENFYSQGLPNTLNSVGLFMELYSFRSWFKHKIFFSIYSVYMRHDIKPMMLIKC